MTGRISERDLDHIIEHTDKLWEELRGQRIFVTGGTGFIGSWLLESFAWANEKLGLGASAAVLTRDLDAFRQKAPHLTDNPAIQFLVGDIESFSFPWGDYPYVIHAASMASLSTDAAIQMSLFETNIQGTKRVMEFARDCGTRKLLYTSSGAIYGKQPSEMTHMPEDYVGAPSTVNSGAAYGHGKRVSEFLCAAFAEVYGFEAKIARCFTFVGPHLPLNSNYAIGNFIADALQGRPIRILGDGTPYRSYLYTADLAIWLWTILFKGKSCYPYNVGSEADLTIGQLAREVARCGNPQVEVEIAKQLEPGKPLERYVPSTQRAWNDLGLQPIVTLREAIERTSKWYSQQVVRTGE